MVDEADAKPSIPVDFKRSLSSQLLALTIFFILVAEIVVMIPSIADRRVDWLRERLEAAYLVGLALDSPQGGMIAEEEANKLFATANILGVTIDYEGTRTPVMSPRLTQEQSRVVRFVNLDNSLWMTFVTDAWASLFSSSDYSIRVVGRPEYASGAKVDMYVSQAALRQHLTRSAINILLLSLLISTLTAMLLFSALDRLIVRPVRRLTRNMAAFERNPEDRSGVLEPSGRHDELGAAERSLAALETRIATLLSERRRLAALGSGISKISHDLRNILASAQLMSDRLAKSDDPRVRKLSPRLLSSLDRAIALSRDTLNYARMDSAALKKERVELRHLVEQAFDDAANLSVRFENEAPADLFVSVDQTQIYRALFNLIRNAVDAIAPAAEEIAGEGAEEPPIRGSVTVSATRQGELIEIAIADTGPGLPDAARESLFEPFKGSTKPGGSGLGVAIASEIARAHGGSLALAKTDAAGTIFMLTLPG